MARTIPDFNAMARARTGKGAAREARRQGLVPGVVYGGGKDPLPINVPFNRLMKHLRAGHFLSTLFRLRIDGVGEELVIAREVQRDVVKDLPIHVDFMRLKESDRIELEIPVEFVGEEEAPGLKRGGTLVVVRPEIELEVTAGNIPDKVVVDLSGYDIGDVITISKVTLPEGAEPTIKDRDFVIANISAPSGFAEAATGGEEAEEGEAEGEGES